MSSTGKITQSELLFERSEKVSPGGVHSPVRAFRGVGGVPRFIRSAQGAYLTDVDGNEYLDFCMSWGPLILGHQDEDVSKVVGEALRRGWSYGTTEPYSLELAEFIVRKLPWVEKIRFVNSGTEAVMAALRLARAATQRSKVLKFEGCYHGHVDSMLVKAGSGLAEMASPDSAGVSAATASETIVAPLNDLEAVERISALHGKEIAAVILEPMPANNGLLLQTDAFLKGTVELARKAGALIILDEVISGFRIGFGGMTEKTGIRPDLVTYGKVIGGGFPVGAYGGRADLMDWIAPVGPVYQAGTLSANPVAMAAGLATLQKLDHLKPYAALEKDTADLGTRIENVARDMGGPSLKIQNLGSVFWAVIGKISTQDGIVRNISEIPETQKPVFAKLFHSLLDQGIYLAPSGFEVGFLSTAHSSADLDSFVRKFKEAWKQVQ